VSLLKEWKQLKKYRVGIIMMVMMFLQSFDLFSFPLPRFSDQNLSYEESISPDFSSSRPGCFQLTHKELDWDCAQQRLQMRLLIQLHKTKADRLKSQNYLNFLVLKRIKYFLSVGEFDYQSVISLMMFPIPKKYELLQLIFQKTPSHNPQLSKVVFEKIRKKNPSLCLQKGKVLPLSVREICSLKIL
jgi:hypothetical protein